MAKEQDGREMAQRLLDEAGATQKAYEAGMAEREAAVKRTREAIVEVIRRNSVYQRTMEVMNDPVLDQLLPLYWKFWNPIELVSRNVTTETPIKVMGRVLFNVKGIELEEEERPVPYSCPRRILPLDPVGFVSKFPVDGMVFGVNEISPVKAYLQSIGLVTMENYLEQSFPYDVIYLHGCEGTITGSYDGNESRRRRGFEDISLIRKVCPSYGGGNCGVIELKTPQAPGRMGDQGKLRIEAGYDLQSKDFLIRLCVYYPFNVIETFKTLEALQGRLAEILVEKGVTSVE